MGLVRVNEGEMEPKKGCLFADGCPKGVLNAY